MNPEAFDLIDGIPTYKLFIGGTWLRSSRNSVVDDCNPATGEVFARMQQAGPEEVEHAIGAAHAASRVWGNSLVAEREAMLLRVCDVIIRRTPEIRDCLIEECGSVYGKALWEIDYVTDLMRSTVGDVRHAVGETHPMSQPGQIPMSIRRPLGVIAGIAPFNSPFLLSMKKIAFALAAGNTFVLKPSEETPVSGVLIADIFAEAGLPEGVLNVIPSPAAPIGEKLLADPRVRMVTLYRFHPHRPPSGGGSGAASQALHAGDGWTMRWMPPPSVFFCIRARSAWRIRRSSSKRRCSRHSANGSQPRRRPFRLATRVTRTP